MSSDLTTLGIKEAHDGLKRGDFTAVELAQASVQAVERTNPEINALIEVFDDVIDQAKAADGRIKKAGKNLNPLDGVPLVVKDNILIKGRVATSGSKILKDYRATYDATVTERLREAGAVFIGRANMDEFAMGSSTETSTYGATMNPHGTKRVPGGSSGGSAAAVAAHMVPAALGSDTGGSIRQPGAFCGVVGLKPTYGTVSRYGLMAMASSLDQIGPLTRSVEDAELLFRSIASHDPMDSTSLTKEIRNNLAPKENKKSLTIGVPMKFVDTEGVDPDVLDHFNRAVAALKDAGHTVSEIDLEDVESSLAVYYIIMPAEASTNLARFDGVRYGFHVNGTDLLADYMESRAQGFGKEVRRRILLGTYVLSSGYYDAYYNKAVAVKTRLQEAFAGAFTKVDAIMTPTTPTPAFSVGEKTSDPLAMYLADIFTVPANLVGIPALSVPFGTVDRAGDTLPIGIQFMGPQMHEETLFTLGKALEERA